MLTTPAPTEVREIAATVDPVLRNHRITLGYHRLAVALASQLGAGGTGNWCAFAVWASRQAGRTIRAEDLRRKLEAVLHVSPEILSALTRVVAAARLGGSPRTVGEVVNELRRLLDIDAVTQRSANAVARGNKLVFEEVGLAVATFLEARSTTSHAAPIVADALVTDTAISAAAGDAPPAGARYLASALRRYDQRATEQDARTRAELLLLGNVEIGYHEQIRVQSEIRAAVDAAIPDANVIRDQLVAYLFPTSNALLGARRMFWSVMGRPAPLDSALDALVEAIRKPLRATITAHLMSLELPDGVTLRLGADLVGTFPTTLQHLQHPNLRALLTRVDLTPDSLAQTGVLDWAELSHRVHYIVDMFRVHQERVTLLTSPYSPAQTEMILAGRTPTGPF